MKVVIAGGGFGGLRLARLLNNKPGFEVTLIDRFNYHQFQPLFYQVATAGLDASNISFPLRMVFHHSKNVRIRLAQIESIDTKNNLLLTSAGPVEYDQLILALGADTNFFNNEGIARHGFPMKSTTEALQIRHSLLRHFEEAVTVKDEAYLQRLMNIVVVGGGPTGVEVSGALAEWKRYVLPKDYPELDFSKMNIYLLEGTGKTLGAMSEISSSRSRKYLEKLGVQVMTDTLVTEYDGKEVKLKDGNSIFTSTVIWAAGIKGNVPGGIDQMLIARGNRIKVDRRNRVLGMDNVYAIGDLAYMETPLYPGGHPQVAPVAMQQADIVAENLKRMERKSTRFAEFEYTDKGSMATVGRNLAVVDMAKPKWHFGGWIAWLIWMGLHLMLILGVKNRLFVFMNWLYNYFTYNQSLRLLFREFDQVEKKPVK